MTDNLRDQIAGELALKFPAYGGAHYWLDVANTAIPIVQAALLDQSDQIAEDNAKFLDNLARRYEAAITEARRESWAHGYANGYMDSGCATVPPSAPMANPYAAGEHDTPASEPDIPLAPSGRKVQRRQSIPPTQNRKLGPNPYAAAPSAEGRSETREFVKRIADLRCGRVDCNRHADDPVHRPAQNLVTPMVVGADGRGVLADDCACGHTRNWHVNPKYECDVSSCLCATFTKPVKLPPPAQQPAGPDVARIRADMKHNQYAEPEDTEALIAALDARDAEIRELRAHRDAHYADALTYQAKYRREIRELRDLLAFQAHAHAHQLDERMALARKFEQRRDDARARLDEIRAHVESSGLSYDEIRAILDRPPHQGAERAEPQA